MTVRIDNHCRGIDQPFGDDYFRHRLVQYLLHPFGQFRQGVFIQLGTLFFVALFFGLLFVFG